MKLALTGPGSISDVASRLAFYLLSGAGSTTPPSSFSLASIAAEIGATESAVDAATNRELPRIVLVDDAGAVTTIVFATFVVPNTDPPVIVQTRRVVTAALAAFQGDAMLYAQLRKLVMTGQP